MDNENEREADLETGASPPSSPVGESVRAEPEQTPQGKADEGVVHPPSAPEQPSPSSGVWPKSAVDRVAKLTARLREYEARAGSSRPVDPSTGREFTAEQIDAMIMERAQIVAGQQTFNSRCNDVAARGASRFPDWQARLNGLTQLVDQTDPRSMQQYNLFLEAALETGNADDIIYRLGSDLNEAGRVLAPPPVRMAMEVGRLGEGKSPGVSKMPKPIRPVGSTSPVKATKPDDPESGHEMPIKDWMDARNKQAADRRIR